MVGAAVAEYDEIEEVEEIWFTDPEGNPVLIDQARDVRLENGMFSVPVKDNKRRLVHGKPEAVLQLCAQYGINIRTANGIVGVRPFAKVE